MSRHVTSSASQNDAIRSCTTGGGAPSSSWKRNGNTTIAKVAPSASTSCRSVRTSSKNCSMASRTRGASGLSNSRSTFSISRPSASTSSRTRAERRCSPITHPGGRVRLLWSSGMSLRHTARITWSGS